MMTTHKLKFETIEERLEWTKMREALDRHSCYTNKNKYYPYQELIENRWITTNK